MAIFSGQPELGIGPTLLFSQDMEEHEELQRQLARAKQADIKLPMAAMARLAQKEVKGNFEVGGRPRKWEPLKADPERSPLMGTDSEKLYNSIQYKVIANKNFKIYSTDIPGKSGAQNFGRGPMPIFAKKAPVLSFMGTGEYAGKLIRTPVVFHPGIPGRPFMQIRGETVDLMAEMIADAVMKGVTNAVGAKTSGNRFAATTSPRMSLGGGLG